jgi:hypothetical protein
VGLLRQADVDLGKVANVHDFCRRPGIPASVLPLADEVRRDSSKDGQAASGVPEGDFEAEEAGGESTLTFPPFLDPSGMLGFFTLASPERVGFSDGKEAFQ